MIKQGVDLSLNEQTKSYLRAPGTPELATKKNFMKWKKNIDTSYWTETELVILRRRSTRYFKKKQVPEHLIKRILEAGRYAPSVGNGQYWRSSVVRDEIMIKDMTDYLYNMGIKMKILDYWERPFAKPFVKILQLLFPHSLHPIPHFVSRLIGEMNFDPLWSAPTVILLYKDVRCIGSPEMHVGIIGQNMVIAAHSLGLGTCWIGLVKGLNISPAWKKKLDITYPYVLSEAICVGYPVGEADGFVARDTHAIDWYENDTKKTIY